MHMASQVPKHWRLSAGFACSLPAHAIEPLGRLEGSGASSLFTSYLATSGSWALGNHTLPSFPPCVTLTQGSDGVTTALQSRNYTIACGPATLLTQCTRLTGSCPACHTNRLGCAAQ